MVDENQIQEVSGAAAPAPEEAIQEESGLGSIQINNEVVANIVAMTAKEVPGVYNLAPGGFGLFGGKKESGSGVQIGVNEDDRYVVSVKLILVFGVQLAKVAEAVQIAIRDQIQNMTNKEVARVDVIVDGVTQIDTEEQGVVTPES